MFFSMIFEGVILFDDFQYVRSCYHEREILEFWFFSCFAFIFPLKTWGCIFLHFFEIFEIQPATSGTRFIIDE